MFSPPNFDAAPPPPVKSLFAPLMFDNTNQARPPIPLTITNPTCVEPMFSRNRFRSTMPTNIRPKYVELPKTPRTNPYVSRFQNTHCQSPSVASNSTTFAEPWISTIVESPSQNESLAVSQGSYATGSNASPLSDPKRKPLRRSVSALAAKPVGTGDGDTSGVATDQSTSNSKTGEEKRPRINFGSFSKKMWKQFNKNNDKQNKKPSTMPPASPVPNQNLKSPKQSPSRKPAKVSPGNPGGKMQLEDRLKMFKKVGMKQNLKMSNVQRMQKERQRDFKLVPEAGRKRLSTESQDPTYARKKKHEPPSGFWLYYDPPLSNQQITLQQKVAQLSRFVKTTNFGIFTIDSLVMLKSPPQKPNSLISDSDCGQVIMRNRDKKSGVRFDMDARNAAATSLIMPMTSTPKNYVSGSRPTSATFEVSKLASPSDSSLCLLGADDEGTGFLNQQNTTMYYSTNALSAVAYTAIKKEPEEEVPAVIRPTPSSSRNEPPKLDDVLRNEDNSSPSSFTSSTQCPSITSTSAQPNQDQMAELWTISQQLKQKRQFIEEAGPIFNNLKTRMIEITTEQSQLMEKKEPTVEEMRRFWDLGRENKEICGKLTDLEMRNNEAQNSVIYLKIRRDSLLNDSSTAYGMTVTNC